MKTKIVYAAYQINCFENVDVQYVHKSKSIVFELLKVKRTMLVSTDNLCVFKYKKKYYKVRT